MLLFLILFFLFFATLINVCRWIWLFFNEIDSDIFFSHLLFVCFVQHKHVQAKLCSIYMCYLWPRYIPSIFNTVKRCNFTTTICCCGCDLYGGNMHRLNSIELREFISIWILFKLLIEWKLWIKCKNNCYESNDIM